MHNTWTIIDQGQPFIIIIWEKDLNEVEHLMQFNITIIMI